jgi:hypothetical protein
MGLQPKSAGCRHWINAQLAPPCGFIATAVDLTVVPTAQRNGELIADFAAESARLGKAHMVGIARRPPANQTWLPGNESDVLPITDAPWFGKGQNRLVDPLRLLSPFSFAPMLLLRGSFGALCDEMRRHGTAASAARYLLPAILRGEGRELGLKSFLHRLSINRSKIALGPQIAVGP